MTSPIKQFSFQEIFTKSDDEIDENIEKGYLSRREVTEVLDHVNKKSSLSCESDGNGGITWKIGSMVIYPNEKTSSTPFWMRRISHWFKLTFSASYRETFEDKISKVHEAYNTYLTGITAAAQAQADAQLQRDIQSKEVEVATAQSELGQINQELAPFITEKERLEAAIQTANEKLQHHATLTSLHNKLETYTLKGAYLENEDIQIVEDLEDALYGATKPALGLRSGDNRRELLNRLLPQIDLKRALETDLTTCEASITTKTAARDQKQTELNRLQEELQALRPTAPVVDAAIPDDAPKNGIQALLAGKANINTDAINVTQHIKNNPLISKKAFFEKISDRADNDFYEKTILPGFKLMATTLNPNDADAMYNKWKTNLENCADAWKAAGSQNQDIDSLTTFDKLFENIMKANDALAFLANSNLNVTEFFNHLSTLKIPEKIEFKFTVPDKKAEELLDAYLKDPAGTSLSPIFAPEFHTWPKDCQFFLAISMLKVRLDNTTLATDATARQNRSAVIAEAETVEEPAWIGLIAGLVKSEFLFNIGLSSIGSMLPAIKPESDRLLEVKNSLSPLKPEQEVKFDEAFAFAKNPERIAFDQAYIKFATDLRDDAIQNMVAKHKNELNLYQILNGVFGLRGPATDVKDAQKEYIKACSTGTSQATKRKKLEALEKTQGTMLIGTLNFVQSLSEFMIKNPTLVKVTTALDGPVMTAMREHGPVNLETDPFIPWLQDTVLQPINMVV